MFKSFPTYRQLDSMDCGPTCLRMIAKYYGRSYTVQYLRERAFITREGVSMLGISDAAEAIGFRTQGVRITLEELERECPLPCVLHWNQSHFVVCYRIRKGRFDIADPATGLVTYTREELRRCWLSTRVGGEDCGTALLLEPSPAFYDLEEERPSSGRGLGFFFRYLSPYRRELLQLVLGMLTASLLQLILPFLTQSLVDVGIRDSSLGFITLVLVAQLMVFVARLSVEFIRGWILLHVNSRINIALISDFLAKLTRLPLRFFDTKMVGDLMQRIGDHGRVESFMTGTSLNTLFSLLNLVVFGAVLAYYDGLVLGLFLLGNGLYVAWVLAFMRWRRELDVKRFAQAAGEQSNLFQLITGMQEIKLNNCETQMRWRWERIQVKLFKIGVKGLALQQYQQLGALFFSQTTNILITFIAARAVVEGRMTLGMMMSLSYIVGQLSAPIEQFISLARSFQDAKISLERLGEIHGRTDEEQEGFIFSDTIARNIAAGEEVIDRERLHQAAETANIRSFIESLPLGYNTKIGMEGNGVSQGQRQRLLIARAVYKDPAYIFLDEATNALDANNEREIMGRLRDFYRGRTVVVVAHRLSTVRDADKIVVLDKGRIVEEGTHEELATLRGAYYTLVKNQLELGG
ncbi:MAG: peptidase domain-containing ABC transporter [Parabacteroides sp.]